MPHDAREPCQFVFSDGAVHLGVLTDTGSETPHIIETLNSLDALLLECNYDQTMLMNGPYPYGLKVRVAGIYGHLDNRQAASLLAKLNQSKLKHLIGMHISEKNNHNDLAKKALCDALGCEKKWMQLASQSAGFAWCEIDRYSGSDVNVLPTSADMRMGSSGTVRWLDVDASANSLWSIIRDFWRTLGVNVVKDEPRIGIMVTEWAENRAGLPKDWLRQALGSMLQGTFDAGQRDRSI